MMQCRRCGRDERASEGYPCVACGTFLCLPCTLKGAVRCTECEAQGKPALYTPVPAADISQPQTGRPRQ